MQNTCDIVLRTHSKDFEWLQYSIPSILKFCKYRKLHLLCPWPQVQDLKKQWPDLTVLPCPVYEMDYLGQQITKMQAWSITNADILIYTDSDAIFIKPYELNLIDGRIPRLVTHYRDLKWPIKWKEVVIEHTGLTPKYEHMRRLPQVFWREDVKDCCEWLVKRWQKPIDDYIQKAVLFSEFNVLGEWCYRYRNDKYVWQDTMAGLPPRDVCQFWSWGGVTDMVKKEISQFNGS